MTDLLTWLPDFDQEPHARVLSQLESASISSADLLSLHPAEVAKRAAASAADVARLFDDVVSRFHKETIIRDASNLQPSKSISTLDDRLDACLDGGIEASTVTEFVGESAVGKTQFLLTLLLSVQLAGDTGLGKSALYISTEAPLQTTRLAQILEEHPKLKDLPSSERPSLQRIHSIRIHDLEAQEHILRYQVPVAISRHNVGLIVLDSIAANYRPEFGRGAGGARSGAESFAKRSLQLAQLGALFREMATNNDLAVVIANQVADRFAPLDSSGGGSLHGTQQPTQRSRPDSSAASVQGQAALETPPSLSLLSTDDPLSLDHQQRFFTGWGEEPSAINLKTPSLGLTWANQLSTRIALLKQPVYEERAYMAGEDREVARWHRTFKVVKSSWCAPAQVDFEITRHGIVGVTSE